MRASNPLPEGDEPTLRALRDRAEEDRQKGQAKSVKGRHVPGGDHWDALQLALAEARGREESLRLAGRLPEGHTLWITCPVDGCDGGEPDDVRTDD